MRRMVNSRAIELAFLADRRDAIPCIAGWYFHQWGHLIPDETPERSVERLAEFLNKDKIPFILVATCDGEIAGAAQLKYREMAKLYPDKEHWLGGVYVAPAYRGSGLASRLAEEIAGRGPQYGVRTLHLQTEQLDGGLYARLGWKALEQVENHGRDVLVMERRLSLERTVRL